MPLVEKFPRGFSPVSFVWYLKWLAGRYFPGEMTRAQIQQLESLGPGDVVVDLGANVGRISFVFALCGATVHAFEPNPYAFSYLKRALGTWPNVHLYNAAASVSDGEIDLYLHEQHNEDPVVYSTGSSIVSEKPNVSKTNSVKVNTIDIATFIKGLPTPPSVIKVDIEGAEVEVMPHLVQRGALAGVGFTWVETHERKIPALQAQTDKMREMVREHGLDNKVDFSWH